MLNIMVLSNCGRLDGSTFKILRWDLIFIFKL